MLNIEGGEIFTDQVFTDFDRRRLQLEPRKHVWGRLIGLQQARGSITRSRRHIDKSDSENLFRNIEVKISGLTGELSKEITDHLASLFKTVQPLIQFIDSQKSNKAGQANGGGDVQARDVIKYADVKIQEVTFFLRCSKCPEMTLFRLDDLSVDRKRNQVKSILNGVGIGKVQFIGSRITCLPSEKLDEKLFHMNSMIINVETVKQKVEIKISDDPIQFSWSPNYHILLHESVIEIVSNIQNISPPATPPSTPTPGSTSNSAIPLRIELLTFDCKHINVNLFLNQNKQIEIKMLNTKYIWNRKNWQADVDSVKFFFDQQIRNDDRPLIDINGQSIFYSLSEDENDNYRASLHENEPNLSTKSNRVLTFKFKSFIFYFPFNYHFYPTFDLAVASFKMVKNLYKSNSEPFNPKSRFPVDLHFIAKTFKILIEDDPFETKLAAVIRHKKEEWVEQVHREEILRQRITEFEANDQKVDIEEMEYRLQLMNTSQYIKQVIHKKKDKRWYNYTELFAWELEDFDLLVLADASMYGYEKVARTIINIDPALEAEDINPWDYTTLWARYIRLNASSWIMKMRDYPREMIKVRDLFDRRSG